VKFRWLTALAIAGAVEAGCGSTSPSTLPAVTLTNVSAAVVTGGVNYALTIHVVNSSTAIEEVTGVGVTLATSAAILGSNSPGLPFATTIAAHASEDSRVINITDTNPGDPIATLVQVTTQFVDSNGQTSSVVSNGTVTLANGATPATPAVPATSFDTGRYRIGIDAAPGRYFAAPPVGCYFERESGLDGTSGEVLGNDFLTFTSPQWIVDIAPTDIGFETSGCGTWAQTPLVGMTTTIGAGMFIVNSQIAPGTYQVAASAGCYWERLSDFSRATTGIVQNAFLTAAATSSVTIAATDVGFDTSPECGTWTPAPSAASGVTTDSVPLSAVSPASTAGSTAAARQAYLDWLKATGRLKLRRR